MNTIVKGGVFGAVEPADANAPLTPSGMTGLVISPEATTLKNLALGASVGIVAIVGALLIARGAMGWYIGKKVLRSNYGWFWGGALGAPGLALLALYKDRK